MQEARRRSEAAEAASYAGDKDDDLDDSADEELPLRPWDVTLRGHKGKNFTKGGKDTFAGKGKNFAMGGKDTFAGKVGKNFTMGDPGRKGHGARTRAAAKAMGGKGKVDASCGKGKPSQTFFYLLQLTGKGGMDYMTMSRAATGARTDGPYWSASCGALPSPLKGHGWRPY